MLPFRDINPSRTFPLVTVSLIIVNVLVFLYMTTLDAQGRLDTFVMQAAVIPQRITTALQGGESSPDVWASIISAMFMHAGPVHLFGNMLYLWIFGNNIEDIMGHVRFLIFYLVCGIIATFAFILFNPHFTLPLLGASGAIAGVLGAYLVRFPNAKVDSCLFLFIFVTVVRLPAIIVLAIWFFLQLLNGTASLTGNTANQGGVAYWAHIGGFLAGMVLVNVFAQRRRYQQWHY